MSNLIIVGCCFTESNIGKINCIKTRHWKCQSLSKTVKEFSKNNQVWIVLFNLRILFIISFFHCCWIQTKQFHFNYIFFLHDIIVHFLFNFCGADSRSCWSLSTFMFFLMPECLPLPPRATNQNCRHPMKSIKVCIALLFFRVVSNLVWI